MRLYSFWLSSASFRARIGLELKGIEREDVHVDLSRGEQLAERYLAENPEGRVPLLIDGGVRLSQALAILEYLEETRPEPALLPRDAAGRARVRQLALLVVADIQPLQNTGPLRYLRETLGVSEEQHNRWYVHWVRRGLTALESHLARDTSTGRFCHGDTPTLADACVVPQLANAKRARLAFDDWPTLERIHGACVSLPAFQRAAPERQPDAPPG